MSTNETSEGYPKNWKHCIIHLNPATGEMHSDGDHSVRHWIEERLTKPTAAPAVTPAPAQGDTPRTVQRFTLASWLSIYGRSSFHEFVKESDYAAIERELAEAKAAAAGFLSDAQKAWAEGDTLRQQLAAATKELHEARVESAGLHCEMQRITAPGGELTALRLDRERLEWLENYLINAKWGDCVLAHLKPEDEKYITKDNFYAAIDAARQQEGRE